MKLLPEEAAFGFTDVYKLTAEEITRLGTGASIKIANLPAGGIVTNAVVYKNKNFNGTSTNLALNVGTALGSNSEFIGSLNLYGLVKVAYSTGNGFASGANGVILNTTSNTSINASFTFTGTVTGGEWFIALTVIDPARFAK
jgi:hypothetical protein